MVTRHKPTREILAATHAASDHDYEKLAMAVVKAITLKQHNIVVRFPYFCKLPDDWTRGIKIKRDESYDYYKVKTFKAADWLHKHGFLPEDAKAIVKSQRSVVNLVGSIERLVANPEDIVYNDVTDVDEDMPR